ncbi:MAG: hypothetical protein HY895_06765 [Deltaproteobacteria bacterium]|nr:hypothetical protein [Deltaproteobacteria bacterium]
MPEEMHGPMAHTGTETALPTRTAFPFLGLPIRDVLSVSLLAAIVFLPFALSLSPDEEDYFVAVLSTVLHARALQEGAYPFWTFFSGFGMPHPFCQNLIYHPFLILAMLLPVTHAIWITYFAHILTAVLSLWLLCRALGITREVRWLCLVTYCLSPTALSYLFVDFWITCMTVWSMLPLLVLIAEKFARSREKAQSYRWAVVFGLLYGWLFLNAHASVAGYALIGIAFFLLGNPALLVKKIKPLLAAVGVIVPIVASRVYDLAVESWRFPATDPRVSQYLPMDWWALLMWPLSNPFTGEQPYYRGMAFGGCFLLLAGLGMVWPQVRHPAKRLLAAGFLGCFAIYFLPIEYFPFISANYSSRDCFILFGILLAGMGLTELNLNRPRLRPLWIAIGMLQASLMAAGAAPYLWKNVSGAIRFYRGEPAHVLRNAITTKPFIESVKLRSAQQAGRCFLSPEAEKLMLRNLTNTHYATLSLEGIRIVNGYFKGIDYHKVFPNRWLMTGQVLATPELLNNKPMLDVLNIRYLFATASEILPDGLRRIEKFSLAKGAEVFLFENQEAWPDAVFLVEAANSPARTTCAGMAHQGILHWDFSEFATLRQEGAVRVQRDWKGIKLKFEPAESPRTLFVSEYFRPEWQCRYRDESGVNRFLEVLPAMQTFMSVSVPAGVHTVRLQYRPFWRVVLATGSWIALASAAALAVVMRRWC